MTGKTALHELRSILIAVLLCLPFSGLSCSARPKPPEADWTLAFYLAGDNSLEREQVRNLHEIIAGAKHLNRVNIVVLLDRDDRSDGENPLTSWKGTRVFEVAEPFSKVLSAPLVTVLPPSIDAVRFKGLVLERLNDPQDRQLLKTAYRLNGSRYELREVTPEQRLTLTSMLTDRLEYLLPMHGRDPVNLVAASEKTLRQFFSFIGDRFPARHYALFLAGHGQGWYEEDPRPRPDPRHPRSAEYYQSLKASAIAAAARWQRFDVIAMDSCLMADIETLWNLREAADYVVLNQIQTPSRGLDYTLLLKQLGELARPDPRRLAVEVVRAYEAGFRDSPYPIMTAAFETGKIAPFARKWNDYFERSGNPASLRAAISGLAPIPTLTATRDTLADVLLLSRVLGHKEFEALLNGPGGLLIGSFRHKSDGYGLSIYLPQNAAVLNRSLAAYRETRWAKAFPHGWAQTVSRLFDAETAGPAARP